MCGIIGYIGSNEIVNILLKGLKKLEYRGYDSAGIGIVNGDGLQVYKKKGEVKELETLVGELKVNGGVGIGHTRWATHGEPCDINSHPHVSANKRFAIVHNGIIENVAFLREHLKKKGYDFQSETDSEVLINLIEEIFISEKMPLGASICRALQMVTGSYCILVMDSTNSNTIYAAKNKSPLVVGVCDHGYFLSSDTYSINEFIKKIVLQTGCTDCWTLKILT